MNVSGCFVPGSDSSVVWGSPRGRHRVTVLTVLGFPEKGNHCTALECPSTAQWYLLLLLTVLKHPWICHFRKEFCWYKLTQLFWLKILIESRRLQLLNNCIFTHWEIQSSSALKNSKGVKSTLCNFRSAQWTGCVISSSPNFRELKLLHQECVPSSSYLFFYSFFCCH